MDDQQHKHNEDQRHVDEEDDDLSAANFLAELDRYANLSSIHSPPETKQEHPTKRTIAPFSQYVAPPKNKYSTKLFAELKARREKADRILEMSRQAVEAERVATSTSNTRNEIENQPETKTHPELRVLSPQPRPKPHRLISPRHHTDNQCVHGVGDEFLNHGKLLRGLDRGSSSTLSLTPETDEEIHKKIADELLVASHLSTAIESSEDDTGLGQENIGTSKHSGDEIFEIAILRDPPQLVRSLPEFRFPRLGLEDGVRASAMVEDKGGGDNDKDMDVEIREEKHEAQIESAEYSRELLAVC